MNIACRVDGSVTTMHSIFHLRHKNFSKHASLKHIQGMLQMKLWDWWKVIPS